MQNKLEKIQLEAELPISAFGQRLDIALATIFADYSRSVIQKWIKKQQVVVNGVTVDNCRYKVNGGEQIKIEAQLEAQSDASPQAIPLNVVYDDDDVIIINKPANLVVHPAAGNASGTLLNGLLHRYPELEALPRAGIVHRLDKDTTGLLVVARNLSAHHYLVDQLQERAFKREYLCVVQGRVVAGGEIDAPIGRHPRNRLKMAISETGKEAITHYRVVRNYGPYSLLRVKLETGRTHQIRVHMADKKLPLVGDQLYGGRLKIPPNASPEWVRFLREFRRQALHARILGFEHPASKEWVEWTCEPPEDFQTLLSNLELEFGDKP